MNILLGMSGGFDSTYSAVKLMEDGHTVEGAILVMHEHTDVESARLVCEKIGIPLHIIDCRESFKNIVENNFISEYKNARTPNPCIICNREIKFKYLYDYAMEHGFDRIATGHYAKILKKTDGGVTRYTLVPPRDIKKDQSYMLSRLIQDVLSVLILPLADEVKEEIRERARAVNMPHADKKDSVEICFIPDNNYVGYIEERVGRFPEGDFVDKNGTSLGKHKGLIHYTVGQRKGLGISLGERMFVTKINKEDNTVTLDTSARTDVKCSLSQVVYMGREPLSLGEEIRADVKVRYTKAAMPATVKGKDEGRIEVLFDNEMSFVTPGQTAVIYLDGEVVASGFID